MPIKEGGDWKIYAGAVLFLGLLVAAWYYGFLDGLSGWFDNMVGRQ
jgi:hypothetical protein